VAIRLRFAPTAKTIHPQPDLGILCEP